MVAALIASLGPLLVGLGSKGPSTWHEATVLASTQETWLHARGGQTRAVLLPRLHDQPRDAKPPLAVWLNLVAWSGLDVPATSITGLLWRSRLLGVVLGLVTLAAIFWLGRGLGDAWLAGLAVLAAASLPLFQTHARMATYDSGLVAFAALAVAGAVWAVRPAGGPPGWAGWLTGWVVCGLGLALAWLSKGPLAVAVVAAGAGAAIGFSQTRRRRNTAALLAALTVAALIVWPWYRLLAEQVPELAQRLQREYAGSPWDRRPVWHYVTHLKWTLPWGVWVGFALLHPFRCTGRVRRRRLAVWTWFVVLFALLSLAPPKASRYLLPVVPALALLVSAAFRDEQTHPRWLIAAHWIGLLVFSVLQAPFLATQDMLVEAGWIDQRTYALLAWPAAAGLVTVMAGLAVWGLRWHWRGRHRAACIVCAMWAAVSTGVYWYGTSMGPDRFETIHGEAQRVTHAAGGHPLRFLAEGWPRRPSEPFLFATRRIVRPVGRDELAALVAGDGPIFVMADTQPANRDLLAGLGFAPVLEFRDAPDSGRTLWRSPVAMSP